MTHQTIHLDPSDVPPAIVHAARYGGRKWQLRVGESVNVSNTQWDGGTRNQYTLVRLEDGQSMHVSDPRPWPESMSMIGEVAIPSGCAVLEHCTFCGKDLGVRIYIRPENATPLLPKPADDLPRMMLIVLVATRSLKPSYNGNSNYRCTEAMAMTGISRSEWDAAKRLCIEFGYLTKIGAITVKGKNAAGNKQLYALQPPAGQKAVAS